MNNVEPLPVADVEAVPRRSLSWILPLGAVVLAVFLVAQASFSQGIRVRVRAPEGHGIVAGDVLRYRGIEVGRIEEVLLSGDLQEVVMTVRLDPEAEGLARAGSRFWVARPHLSLDGVQGLETIVGARYLATVPGPASGPRQTEFEALVEPPVPERIEVGGLEIMLEAPSRFSLAAGAPLTYRQIRVGTVLSVGLSSDATSVEIRVYVRPPYVHLVRDNSVFWETGGVELGLSLTGGFNLDVGSLRSVLVGGIALATPPQPGGRVGTGQRFTLHGSANEDWLEWGPPLPIGGNLLPDGIRPPRMLRGMLRWKEGRLLTRTRERQGWVSAVGGGLFGPLDLFRPGEDAIEGSVQLEVAGTVHVPGSPLEAGEWLGIMDVEVPGAVELSLEERVRTLGKEPEDSLVYGDPAAPPMALSSNRLTADGEGWAVDGAVSFEPSWHGACVLGRSDGALLGILLVEDGSARVVGVKRP